MTAFKRFPWSNALLSGWLWIPADKPMNFVFGLAIRR